MIVQRKKTKMDYYKNSKYIIKVAVAFFAVLLFSMFSLQDKTNKNNINYDLLESQNIIEQQANTRVDDEEPQRVETEEVIRNEDDNIIENQPLMPEEQMGTQEATTSSEAPAAGDRNSRLQEFRDIFRQLKNQEGMTPDKIRETYNMYIQQEISSGRISQEDRYMYDDIFQREIMNNY